MYSSLIPNGTAQVLMSADSSYQPATLKTHPKNLAEPGLVCTLNASKQTGAIPTEHRQHAPTIKGHSRYARHAHDDDYDAADNGGSVGCSGVCGGSGYDGDRHCRQTSGFAVVQHQPQRQFAKISLSAFKLSCASHKAKPFTCTASMTISRSARSSSKANSRASPS